MNKLFFLSIFSLLIVIAACKKDEIEDDDQVPTCQTENMSYSNDIKPIFVTYCTGCHGGSDPEADLNLELYDHAKFVADNGMLSGAINHSAGFTPMPFELAKLDECDIDKIDAWIAAGAPNN